MSRIATIQDKNGDVWSGKVESKGPDVMDLVIGVVCPPYLVGALGGSDETTVVVNGERHTGSKVR